MLVRMLNALLSLLFLVCLMILPPAHAYAADYDLRREIPLRFSYQGADTLGWDKGTPWTPLIPFAVDFKGYLSMGNVPAKISVPATLVIECDSSAIYPGNQAACRAWVESADDPTLDELSSNYGFSLGIQFRDWWTETEIANIGKEFALIIQSDGPMPMGDACLCGMDTFEFASLPVDQLIPGSGQSAKAVRGILSSIGDSGVDLNMASLAIAGELVVEGNYVRLIMADSDIQFYGLRDPSITDPADDPNVKPFALTIPSEQSLADHPNYSIGSRVMFYEPTVQYSMNLYNTAGLEFTLVPPLSFSIMPSAVDKGRNILSYACPDPSTLHNGAYYKKVADDFKISSDMNTTVSFPLTDTPDLPDIAVTGFFVDGHPLGKLGKVFAGEWTGLTFQITNIGNRSTQGPEVGSPEPVFVWSLFVDGQPALDIFGRPIYMRKLDKNQDGSADWIDPTERAAVIIPQNGSYLITGFTHSFTEGPHTLSVTTGYNEYKTTENGQPVYGIGDYHTGNNMRVTAHIYANAPRGTVIGVIETNPCGGDCGVNGIRVCLKDAAGGEYSECQNTGVYNERNGVYRFEHVPTGDYYLEYLPVKPSQKELDEGAPYYAPRSFYFHHERNDTDDFNYSTTRSGMWIYQYQNLDGVVVDNEKIPLPEVTVRVGDAGITAITDEKGIFVFTDVPPFRQYTLYFEHPTCATKKVVFDFAISDSDRRETTLTGGNGWTPTYWDSDLNGTTSGPILMTQDLAAPTLYVEPLPNQGYAGNSLTFQLRSDDGDKDTYQYRYLIYDGTTLVRTGPWKTYTAPSDPSDLVEGAADIQGLSEHALSLVIEVRDAAGSVTQSGEIPFTKDSTAPVISAVVLQDPASGNPAATYSKEVDVAITIGNEEAGTLAAQLSNDGGSTWSDPFLFSGTSALIRQWRVTEKDVFSGTKTVHLKVIDLAGNAATASDDIPVDTTGSVYLAGGARYVNTAHVPLHINIVPPDGEHVYWEDGTTGDFRLGSTGSDRYRAQRIILDSPLTFNKLQLSLDIMTTAPYYPFVGQPGALHVKLVTALDENDPTCAAATTLVNWTGDREKVYGLTMSTTGGLPIYLSEMITLNPGTYYLLVYADEVDASNYYTLYANDYGYMTYPSSPSFVYVETAWQFAPLSIMSNQVPHISFHLWNNDPGEIRIAADGNCGALGEQDWEDYVFPDAAERFVDFPGTDGWKTVCVEYRNQSHPSSKDRTYYASVYLDTTLPTAVIEYPRVDPVGRMLYFDLQAEDDSGVEWIFWTVPGAATTAVPYQSSLALDVSGLPPFSAVEFTFQDLAGNESEPTLVYLKREDDFSAPSLEMTIDSGSGFTTNPEITLHFNAQDNMDLSRILCTETQTGTTWSVPDLSGTFHAGDLVVDLPALTIDGADTVLDGVYRISAYAEDGTANRSKGVNAEIVLDRKAPKVGGLSLTSVTGRPVSTSSQFLMHIAGKDELGPMFLRHRINGGGWSAFQPIAQGENTLSLTGPEPLPQEYTVEVEVKDGAGNTTGAQSVIRLNRAPSRPAVVSPSGVFFGNAPTLTLSAYTDPDGDSEAAVWFLVRKADDGQVVFNTGLLQDAVSFQLPAGQLSYDVGYTVTGSTMDSFGQWSGWSEPAGFTLKRPLLTVARTGTGGVGSGTVMSGGGEIDCGVDCSEVYDPGRSVRLTASPDSEAAFVGWSGDACGDAGPRDCLLVMDADKSITARFAMKGDLNGNGSHDLGDVILALQISAQVSFGGPFYPASVGADPAIGLREALFILQKIGELR